MNSNCVALPTPHFFPSHVEGESDSRKVQKGKRGAKAWRKVWQVEHTPPPPTLLQPSPCQQLIPRIVYSQINFTHFTAVLNYLVFYYYNIYLIL